MKPPALNVVKHIEFLKKSGHNDSMSEGEVSSLQKLIDKDLKENPEHFSGGGQRLLISPDVMDALKKEVRKNKKGDQANAA